MATFRGVWDTLSLDDLFAPVAAFQRVVAQLGQPLARMIREAVDVYLAEDRPDVEALLDEGRRIAIEQIVREVIDGAQSQW